MVSGHCSGHRHVDDDDGDDDDDDDDDGHDDHFYDDGDHHVDDDDDYDTMSIIMIVMIIDGEEWLMLLPATPRSIVSTNFICHYFFVHYQLPITDYRLEREVEFVEEGERDEERWLSAGATTWTR